MNNSDAPISPWTSMGDSVDDAATARRADADPAAAALVGAL
jgi:hypothetical protein